MRVVTYGGASSLDGFIARRDGSVDWLHHSADVQEIMGAYWATIDTMLMGRKTWEIAAAHLKGKRGSQSLYKGITTYVFSRTLDRIDVPGVKLVRADPGPFVRELKTRSGKGICVMGGGELAGELFDAGVIDEVGVNVQPIFLGDGIPFVRALARDVKLRLKESRPLQGGCVY